MTARRFFIALTALVAIPAVVVVAARLAVAERPVTAKVALAQSQTAAVPEPAVAEQPILYAQINHYDDDGSDDRPGDDGDSDDPALDDGRGHLKNANLTFEEAREIARRAVPGADITEIDLEHSMGKLIFEIDAGSKNVKIDAKSGEVISVSDRPAADND